MIREVIRGHPELYYKIPCEWNVQVYAHMASECCPVVWPLYYPDQVHCWTELYPNAKFRPLKLVHYDTHSKPDDENVTVSWPPITSGVKKKLTSEFRR